MNTTLIFKNLKQTLMDPLIMIHNAMRNELVDLGVFDDFWKNTEHSKEITRPEFYAYFEWVFDFLDYMAYLAKTEEDLLKEWVTKFIPNSEETKLPSIIKGSQKIRVFLKRATNKCDGFNFDDFEKEFGEISSDLREVTRLVSVQAAFVEKIIPRYATGGPCTMAQLEDCLQNLFIRCMKEDVENVGYLVGLIRWMGNEDRATFVKNNFGKQMLSDYKAIRAWAYQPMGHFGLVQSILRVEKYERENKVQDKDKLEEAAATEQDTETMKAINELAKMMDGASAAEKNKAQNKSLREVIKENKKERAQYDATVFVAQEPIFSSAYSKIVGKFKPTSNPLWNEGEEQEFGLGEGKEDTNKTPGKSVFFGTRSGRSSRASNSSRPGMGTRNQSGKMQSTGSRDAMPRNSSFTSPFEDKRGLEPNMVRSASGKGSMMVRSPSGKNMVRSASGKVTQNNSVKAPPPEEPQQPTPKESEQEF